MLSGFENAVGPIQPSERPQVIPWPCQVAIENGENGSGCKYLLFDGGIGRMFAQCDTHGYSFLATDWTAPNFTEMSLGEYAAGIAEAFETIRKSGVEGVSSGNVTTSSPNLGKLFDAILANIRVIAEKTGDRE